MLSKISPDTKYIQIGYLQVEGKRVRKTQTPLFINVTTVW